MTQRAPKDEDHHHHIIPFPIQFIWPHFNENELGSCIFNTAINLLQGAITGSTHIRYLILHIARSRQFFSAPSAVALGQLLFQNA